MRVGSLPWLLRHEIRVRWRELIGDTSPVVVVLLGLGVLLFAHFMLYELITSVIGDLSSPLPPGAIFAAALLTIVMLSFAVSIGINNSVVALFDRGDLDLLVSSPIPERTIFAGRVLGVAAVIFVTLGVFVVPIGTLGLLLGLPQLLGIFPLLLAISLIGAALGMVLTLLLVRAIGPRRARTLSQVLAALGGAILFLLTQLVFVFDGDNSSPMERVERWLTYFEPGGTLAADSAIWLPARTLYLDPLATLITLAAGVLLVWATVSLLHRSFALGLGLSDSPRRRTIRDDHKALRFSNRGTLRLLVSKEWRLILRDPFLISQTLLQIVYLLPVAYILFVPDASFLELVGLGPALATVLVMLATTLAASLARIVVAGEEASDLLVVSPLAGVFIRRAKLLAALTPVWAISLPLVIVLGLRYPLPGAVAAFAMLGATLSAVSIWLWNPVTAKRQDLFRGNKVRRDPVSWILEGMVQVSWWAATYLLAIVNPWGLVVLLVALALVFVCLLRARAKGFAYAI